MEQGKQSQERKDDDTSAIYFASHDNRKQAENGNDISRNSGINICDAFGHHEIRDIKRGAGQSAVKSAAYITGDSIYDDRLGLTFGRSEKAGRVLASGTVGPKDSNWTPAQIWSAAEKSEIRCNARVAQERVLALPHELDEAAHRRLLNGYALHLRDRYGVAATWALHAPNNRGDQRNTHGHILITTRTVTIAVDGAPHMGAKVRALSGDRTTVSAEVEYQRKAWAKRVNKELEHAGSSRRMDHRSHARRAEAGEAAPGIEPGTHRGAAENARQQSDPTRMHKVAGEEQSRRRRNQTRTTIWQALEDNKAATTALLSLEKIQRAAEQETTAVARWIEKETRDWERWHAAQTSKKKPDSRY